MKIHTVDIEARNMPIEIYRIESADSVRIIFLPKAGVDIVTCETIDGTLTFRHRTRILGFNFDIQAPYEEMCAIMQYRAVPLTHHAICLIILIRIR